METEFFDGVELSQLQYIDNLLNTVIMQEDEVKKPKQIREIVPIEVWLNSSYYVGDWAKDLYSYWKFKIAKHVRSGSPEVVFTGSIGTGKSTAAYIIVLRKLYELSCYDYPQRLFGLSDKSHIFFVYLSISFKHAVLSGFGQIREMVDNIPYFTANYGRDKKVDSMLNFPGRISIIPGTDNLSVISLNLLGCIQDEADFRRRGSSGKSGDVERAHRIYADITDRRTSRFMDHGYDPGISAIISSSTYESSFVASRVKTAHKHKSTVLAPKLYEVKPEKYSKENFCVFKGTEQYEAFIVNDIQDVIDLAPTDMQLKIRALSLKKDVTGDKKLDYILKKLPLKFKANFLFIPIDFRKNFETDIYRALNNIAGESIVKSGRLFSSSSVWRSNIDPQLQHPFTRPEVELSVVGMDQLMDFFKPHVMFEEIKDKQGGFLNWKLKRHPGQKRFVHIDQSTSKDSTGIGVTHPSVYVEDPDTMLRVPVVELDFALRIKPMSSGKKVSIAKQISIAKIRKFFFQLVAMGMQIGKVTYDQYASADSLQIFTRKGILADRQSVDKDDSQYTQFIDIMTEKRFNMYSYPLFEKEMFNLLHDQSKRKVDHPDVNEDGTPGTKDVSDGVVGSVNLSLNECKLVMVTPEEILSVYKFKGEIEGRGVKFTKLIDAGYDQVKKGHTLTKIIGEEYGGYGIRRE